MMKLYVATHNPHKVREIAQILPGVEVVADDPEGVEENAPDFAGNALVKVRAIAARHPGEWCLADDSGLEVAALGGAPGVRSARYAGEPTDTAANNALLLKNLDGVADRRARFTCCCALVDPSGEELTVHGHCPGRIALAPSGAEGFGYDPLFVPNGYDKSFAELSADEKNAISHRGRALEKVRGLLGADASRAAPPAARGVTAWLRFFRVVNIPTVPGDVLVGAALWPCFAGCRWFAARTAALAAASVFLYLFGLADNDIAGAGTDRGRPIPDGEISLGAARLARFICLAAAAGVALAAGLPGLWWPMAFSLLVAVVLYNRTKWSFLMGVCRALNLGCGVVAANTVCWMDAALLQGPAAAACAVWFLYIWAVTKYSEGEDLDPEKKRRVGMLVGGIVYLQLLALMYLALRAECNMPLLLAGAALLAVLRLMKVLLPKVSAS